MQKRKTQTLRMLNAVQRFLLAQRNVLEQWTGLKAAIASFTNRLTRLNGTLDAAGLNTNSITAAKQELRNMLAYQLALIAAQAYSWAYEQGNKEIMLATNFTEKKLLELSDTNLQVTGSQLLKLVETRNSDFGDYQVETAMLTTAKNLLVAFKSDIEAPRNATAGKSSSLKLCYAEIKYLQGFLEGSMDRLMLHTRPDYPEIYDEYLANRDVIEAGSRETHITGQVTAPDGKAAGRAIIVAEEADKGFRYEATSDSNGNYVLRVPEAGNYKITFSHPVLGNTSGGIISISPGDQPRMNMMITA